MMENIVYSSNYDNIKSWLISGKQKEGNYMTRICSAASDDLLSVSADSMYTNTQLGTFTYDNQKLFYRHGIIIGLLGMSEIHTLKGMIDIKDCINEHLDSYNGNNILETIENVKQDISECYDILKYPGTTQLIFMWIHQSQFYCYPFEIRFNGPNTFGCPILILPFGAITEESFDKYKFNKHSIDSGEGILDIKILEYFDNKPKDFSYNIVKEAVKDKTLKTVGGNIYTITMNNEGNIMTYINEDKKDF